MAGRTILLLGGARSGKSAHAQKLAEELGGRVLFVATAQAFDHEMKERIANHIQARPAGWRTLEQSSGLGRGLEGEAGQADVIIVDCLTLLVSNIILAAPDPAACQRNVTAEIEGLCASIRKSAATFIVVSNEVGLGLVPDNALGRLYRDLLGKANQIVAACATEVYLMVAGIPMKVKG